MCEIKKKSVMSAESSKIFTLKDKKSETSIGNTKYR